MSEKAGAVIIGGGIAGTATAYYLVKNGLSDVILFEKDTLANGSTGRCLGAFRQQFSDEPNIKLMIGSVKILEKLEEELGRETEVKQGGYLLLAYSEQELAGFRKNVALQKSLGLDVDLITAEEAKEIVPSLNAEGVLGATFCPTDGGANPFLVTHGYADTAREMGVKVRLGEEITSINAVNGEIKSVKTNKGETIETGFVVNAAGIDAGRMAEMVDVHLPLTVERHEALATEPIEPLFNTLILDFTNEHGCYFQQKESGEIVGCFTPVEPKLGVHFESSLEFLTEMSKRMIRLVPPLKHVRVVRQWAGHYINTPDLKPILGESEKVKGFVNANGFSGHGFMMGPHSAKLLSELIIKGKTPFDMAPFSPERFEKGVEASKEQLK